MSGSTTLIVCIPIALAGLRLMPRSSRKTHSLGSTSRRSPDLVETPLRLSNAHHTRLDDLVEQVVDLRKRRAITINPGIGNHRFGT